MIATVLQCFKSFYFRVHSAVKKTKTKEPRVLVEFVGHAHHRELPVQQSALHHVGVSQTVSPPEFLQNHLKLKNSYIVLVNKIIILTSDRNYISDLGQTPKHY